MWDNINCGDFINCGRLSSLLWVDLNALCQRLEDIAIESSTVRLFCQQMPDGLAGEEEDNDSARKALFH